VKLSWSSRVVWYGAAIIFASLALYPLLLMLISSFKTTIEIFQHPFALPSSWSLDTYKKLLDQVPFGSYFTNSIIVSVASVLLVILFGSMASFYIARFSFKWNGALLFFFLIGMMIPIKLGIVPLYMLMRNLGLTNSLLSLICMYTATGLPLAVLILTSFFKTLPHELEEAARIDGAGDLRILWSIIFPLMRPVLGTVMIVNFIGAWNDFFFPLIFIIDDAKKTIPIGMLSLFGEHSADWSTLFAGLTLSSLPMIILFFFASKQFMDGLTAGAVK
jgi:raffinose/stachyose/melibiose transport system permease protein